MPNTMTRAIIAAALIAFLLATSSTTASADQPETMQFVAIPPLQPAAIFGNAWWIYASGPIDKGATQRLAAMIAEKHIANDSMVFLNSPGGNIFAGMRLGELIRGHEFRTYVGAQGDAEEESRFGKHYKVEPGVCMSACALTFLGGSFRYLTKGGVYGVHRFFAGADAALNSDQAQIVSATILQYIRDMGADDALFTEMTQAGEHEINVLPEARLLALGVVNNGVGKTAWTIEAAGSFGLYLKGQRDTVFGGQKLTMMCAQNGRIALMAIFDPKGNADKITKMSALSAMIDGNAINLTEGQVGVKPVLNNGWINILVVLDSHIVSRIMTAKTIGLIVQFSFAAPTFMGIGDMDFTDGAKKLPAFMASCK